MRDPMTDRSTSLARSLAVLALAASGSVALAQPKPDADWPCAQRKVSTLGSGAVWTGPDLAAARQVAYAGIARIGLEGSFYRHDIAEEASR